MLITRILVSLFLIASCSNKDGNAPGLGGVLQSPSAQPLPGSNVGAQPIWTPGFSSIVLSNSLNTTSALSNGATILSAVGNNATVVDTNNSTIPKATGTTGGGLTFDGVDDSISFGDSPAFQITNNLTISMWYRKNAESLDWTRLIGKGDATNRNYGIWEHPGSAKNLLVQIYNTDGSMLNLNSTGTVELNQWTHITISRTGTSMSLYINGALDSSGTITGTPRTSTDPLTVGWSFHGFQNMSAGETTVWNVGLTAGEIQTVFNHQRSAFGL